MQFRRYNFYCPGCKRVMKRSARVGQKTLMSGCGKTEQTQRMRRTTKQVT